MYVCSLKEVVCLKLSKISPPTKVRKHNAKLQSFYSKDVILLGQHGITYGMPSYALFRDTCDSLTECGKLSLNRQTFDSLKQICYIITVEFFSPTNILLPRFLKINTMA